MDGFIRFGAMDLGPWGVLTWGHGGFHIEMFPPPVPSPTPPFPRHVGFKVVIAMDGFILLGPWIRLDV